MTGLLPGPVTLGSAAFGEPQVSLAPASSSFQDVHSVPSRTRSVTVSPKHMPTSDPQGVDSPSPMVSLPFSNSIGPAPLPLPSGDVGSWCGMGGIPHKDVIPTNLHALIPSKFKYKFPRERIPRHKSYEVLAVEDNPYAPPPAPVPPKKPHKKKSIFGIAKRIQPNLKRYEKARTETSTGDDSQADQEGQKGWVRDFKCFLCTSTDFVSDEQIQLQAENAQLDEALAEYQDTTRIQAIQLLETKKAYEEKLKENQRASEEAAKNIESTKAALEAIQAERDQLLQLQEQTDRSLALIREQVGNGLNTIFQSQTEHSEELIEQMRTFCVSVNDLLAKALPAERPRVITPSPIASASSSPVPASSPSPPTTLQASPSPVAPSPSPPAALQPSPEPAAPLTPPGTPKLISKKRLKKGKKKGKGKGKKKVLKKKGKKLAGKGKKGKRTKGAKKKTATSSQAASPPVPSSEAVIMPQRETPFVPYGLPFNALGSADNDPQGRLQFVLYPGMLDQLGPQPNDEARYILERRLEAMKELDDAIANRNRPPTKSGSMIGTPTSPSPKAPRGSPKALLRRGSVKSLGSPTSGNSDGARSPGGRGTPPQKSPPSSKLQAKSPAAAMKEQPATLRDKKNLEILLATQPESSPELEIIRKKSLGRLWSLKAPPPLPHGLLSKIFTPERAHTFPPDHVQNLSIASANTGGN